MLTTTIKNEIEKKQLDHKTLCEKCGVSPSALSNWLSGKSEISFPSVVTIVKYLFQDKEIDLITKYILEQKKPLNLRQSLEYASFYNLNNILRILIDKEMKSENIVNREWAVLYDIEYRFKNNKININNFLNELKQIKVKSVEMKVMKQWLEIFGHHKQRRYSFLKYLLDEIKWDLDEIKDDFIKTYFLSRFHFALSNVYFYLDDIKQSRESAKIVIEYGLNEIDIAKSLHILGLSYIYESYDQAIAHLNKAKLKMKNLKETKWVENINRSINFVNNFWDKPASLNLKCTSIENKHSIIYTYIKNNNVDTAKKMINEIDINVLDDYRKAFYYYYQGIISNNIDSLYMSLHFFNQSGDKFFGKLPCIELIKLGERKSAVTTAYGREFFS